jgi:hypothetical protein
MGVLTRWNSGTKRHDYTTVSSLAATPASAAGERAGGVLSSAAPRGTSGGSVGAGCPPVVEYDYPSWDYYDASQEDEDLVLDAHEQHVEKIIVLVVLLSGLVLITCLIFCMCYNSRFRHYLPRWLVRYRSIDYLAGLGLSMVGDSEHITTTYTIPAINVQRPLEEVPVDVNALVQHREASPMRFIDTGPALELEGVLSAGRPVASTLLTVPGADSPSPRIIPRNIPSSPSASENSADTLSITLQVPVKNNVNKPPPSSLESTPNASMTSLTSEISLFEDAPLELSLNDEDKPSIQDIS